MEREGQVGQGGGATRSGGPPDRRQELDDLSDYIRIVKAYPALTREAEHDLAVRAQRGDLAARKALVGPALALVVAVARRQRRGVVRLDDLIQEGNVGLVRAAGRFDPEAGTRFSTYAVWWIRAYVTKYLKEARSAVRPRSGTVAQADLSLDAPAVAEGEDGDVTHVELLADAGPGPEARCISAEGDRNVRAALGRVRKRLGDVGWDIVHARLQQDPPRTLAEIGSRWGFSRERVRQIEGRTRRLLFHHLDPALCEVGRSGSRAPGRARR